MADTSAKQPKKFRYADLETLRRDRPFFHNLRPLKAPEKADRFGNPAEPGFESRIVTVHLAGIDPTRNTAQCHQDIAVVLQMAFEEIASLGLDYQIRPIGDHASYFLRYGKSTRNKNLFAADPVYSAAGLAKERWNTEYAKYDLERGRFGVPVGDEKIPRWYHLSNHSWGTAIDINPSTNPMKSGAYFDMPVEIVRVMSEWGFYWGGYFNPPDGDYMHFEFAADEIRTSSFRVPAPHVTFPLAKDDKREAPTKYYVNNEEGAAGFYPLGASQDLHGGIHLRPPAGGPAAAAGMTPVRAALPGYVVAARLVRTDSPELDARSYRENPILQESVQNQPLGFVLLRHDLENPDDKAKPWPFYSLYMHLSAPDWDQPDDKFEAAPWLERLLRMRFGGVVALDPAKSEDLGKTFWAKQAFDDKGSDPVPVRRKEAPLPRKDGDRVVGFGKKTPPAIAESIAALRTGAVITFDRQVLPVDRGEIIGFLAGEASPRYLHWEIFAPPGQGLTKLREKAAAFGVSFADPLKELREDNFLDAKSVYTPNADNELASVFSAKTDPVLSPALEPDSRGHLAGYGMRLAQAYQKGEAFAHASKADSRFTYPVKLKFANSYRFKPDAGASAASRVEVTYLRNGEAFKKETAAIAEFGAHITLPLDVPAAADALSLSSPYFRLDLSPPPPATPAGQSAEQMRQASEKQKQEREKLRQEINAGRWRLFKAVTGRRWRDLVLEHINEWNPKHLPAYAKARLAAGYIPKEDGVAITSVDELVKRLEPLTWWAPKSAEAAKHGERPAVGGESRFKSLFESGNGFLPEDGHVENMHPVTTLWLLELLQEEKAIKVLAKADHDGLLAKPAGQSPMYLGITPPAGEPRVGGTVALALVHHGYYSSCNATEEGVAFVANSEDHGPRLLGVAAYREGAAVLGDRFPFWRKTTLEAQARKENDTEGPALVPESTGLVTLDLPRPEVSGATLDLVPVPKSARWVGTFIAKDHCPYALEGYLAFDCWKADAGKKPDLSLPAIPGTCLLPVVAECFPPEEHERGDLVFEGEFILNKAPKNAKKWSPKKARVSTSLVLQDFIGHDPRHPVADAEPTELKLAWQLVQRLQALRDLCRAPKKGEKAVGFEIVGLDKDGLVAMLKPSSMEPFLERASHLPPSDLFKSTIHPDGDKVRVEYSPLPTTGTLQFTVDPTAALRELANKLCTKNGEQLFARPSFWAPNGGHYVFSYLNTPARHTEDSLVLATEGDLKDAVLGDCIGLWTDTIFPPAHAFGLGPLSLSMTRSGVSTQLTRFGTAAEWKGAKVQITCKVAGGVLIKGGRPEGDRVSETWYLEKWKKGPRGVPEPKDYRWNRELVFTVELSGAKKDVPLPAPVTFNAKPKLVSLDLALDGDRVVFAGKTHAMPTSAGLAIRCERLSSDGQWQEATDVKVNYPRRYYMNGKEKSCWGSPEENGNFAAWVNRAAFAAGSYRFVWHATMFSEMGVLNANLDLKVQLFDVVIPAVTTRPYTAEELGGTSTTGEDDE